MIGNSSCGVHAVMAGRTADNVRASRCSPTTGCGSTFDRRRWAIIAAVTFAGRSTVGCETCATATRGWRERYPKILAGCRATTRRAPSREGLSRREALVGSEGLVTVIEATVEPSTASPSRSLLVLGWP
ncbi:MAG: hypothetical protein R3A52_23245 [Polyangiales bacterium]